MALAAAGALAVQSFVPLGTLLGGGAAVAGAGATFYRAQYWRPKYQKSLTKSTMPWKQKKGQQIT